ncbi:MAG: DUF1987 domain-containing protein [Bacteroidales bacterium]|nr:DUF1987 domain-containing protein [Bacteroidales bacterium]
MQIEKKGNSSGFTSKITDLSNLKQRDDLEYIFRGDFSPAIVSSILDLAKATLEEAKDTYKIKSKIFYIMGESLQNIARHQNESFKSAPDKYSLFAIHKKNLKYYITTGNIIDIKEIDALKEKIEKINNLAHEDLRNYSRNTRSEGEFSEKGGAGLGLIEMAKRSGNKLEYDFSNIDNDYSYFYLNTEIPVISEKEIDSKSEYSYTIEDIKELHQILTKDNVILFFKGAFNQSSLLNLLSIVENQLRESTITIKIYNIMVELLQNVSKHADNYSKEVDWKPGIFLITENDDEFSLVSGNYIQNAKIESLKEKLEETNNLTFTDLVLKYNQRLQNFDIKSNEGLGLLDLRRKSKQNLIYSFQPINDNLSFFTLQVTVKKSNEMTALIIDATMDTPRIHFDPKNNIFEISNKSLPEDANDFYRPVIDWLENYKRKPNKKTDFSFKLEYFNTASARYISQIITILDKMSKKHDVKINWYYQEIDEDMLALGEEFYEMTDMDFELIEI